MTHFETNVYSIENLGQLSCKYVVYRVRGLSPDSEDYYRNLYSLTRRLSELTRSPVAILQSGEPTLIAQLAGHQELPETMDLVRVTARIEKLDEPKELKFDSLTSETARLAARFLQFCLQGALHDNPNLWQPRSGYPFYHKQPDPDFERFSEVFDLYRGFTFRVVRLPDGKLGMCVDVRSKYVRRDPLPTQISRNEFEQLKGLTCVYEFGNTWYEIRIVGLNDLNASQVLIPPDGESLFDYVHERAGLNKSKNLRTLPKDCSVLVYLQNKQERNVPSGLCRLTLGPDNPEVSKFHSQTIKNPNQRRDEIRFVVDKYFRNLSFQSVRVKLSERARAFDQEALEIPDIEFGGGHILSVRSSPGAIHVALPDFPAKKKELLHLEGAGIYVRRQFERQYLFLPQSIYTSFGQKFVKDIEREVQSLCRLASGMSYEPVVIPYNDSVQRSVVSLGKEILRAVDEFHAAHGFGIVMIPKLPSRRRKGEDELANWVMRTLRGERDLYLSIIHTAVPEECYKHSVTEKPQEWTVKADKWSKFKGYLENVVLNKMLITNGNWPFILRTPLNADLVIGIDVKNSTAGFTLIYRTGGDLRFELSASANREQLGRQQMLSEIYKLLKDEGSRVSKIEHIVVHRQGELFATEELGVLQALEKLRKEGILLSNCKCTFAEIRTTAKVPLRIFRVATPQGRQEERATNPQVGKYYVSSDDEAFLCTTGYPYRFEGSTTPLHIVKRRGPLSLKAILEDVFSLSNLTWTKVDDCSRLPLSIKMGDIRLREFAGEYDRDAFAFDEEMSC